MLARITSADLLQTKGFAVLICSQGAAICNPKCNRVATTSRSVRFNATTYNLLSCLGSVALCGAGDGDRTRDVQLGNRKGLVGAIDFVGLAGGNMMQICSQKCSQDQRRSCYATRQTEVETATGTRVLDWGCRVYNLLLLPWPGTRLRRRSDRLRCMSLQSAHVVLGLTLLRLNCTVHVFEINGF
jgi:hypothetical protein